MEGNINNANKKLADRLAEVADNVNKNKADELVDIIIQKIECFQIIAIAFRIAVIMEFVYQTPKKAEYQSYLIIQAIKSI